MLAGQAVTLSISAVKISGFTYDQIIECTNWNKLPLSEIEGVIYLEDATIAGLTLDIQVQIPSVKLSHAGIYYCDTLLETPHHMDNISDSTNFAIKIEGMS